MSASVDGGFDATHGLSFSVAIRDVQSSMLVFPLLVVIWILVVRSVF